MCPSRGEPGSSRPPQQHSHLSRINSPSRVSVTAHLPRGDYPLFPPLLVICIHCEPYCTLLQGKGLHQRDPHNWSQLEPLPLRFMILRVGESTDLRASGPRQWSASFNTTLCSSRACSQTTLQETSMFICGSGVPALTGEIMNCTESPRLLTRRIN